MPRGDRTGPAGQGPMTGRRLGNCITGIRRFFGMYTVIESQTSPKHYIWLVKPSRARLWVCPFKNPVLLPVPCISERQQKYACLSFWTMLLQMRDK